VRQLKATSRAWTFALTDREREFLLAVLRAYPVLPPDYQPLSRDSADRVSPEDLHLLHDALAEQRGAHQARLRRWLRSGSRFRPCEQEWQFNLARTDLDWMLQVLNDIRVGHWLKLGCPEDIHDPESLLRQDPAAFFYMEAAGMFQMQFLQARHGPPDPD
jgi:hypothetical protein